MIQVIDNFDNQSSWFKSTSFIQLSNDTQFAFDEGTSMKMYFPINLKTFFISKNFASQIDCSNFGELRFQIRTLYHERKYYTNADQFILGIELIDTISVPAVSKKWYVPIARKREFNCVSLDIADLDCFNLVAFRIETNDSETVWLDYMIIVNAELEYDVLSSIKDKLDDKIILDSTNLSISATAGDSIIEVDNIDFLTGGSLIKIEEGVNSELHQIKEMPQLKKIRFTNLKDGKTLLNSYTTAATVRQIVSADFQNNMREVYLPAFTIWGFEAERNLDRESFTFDYFDYAKNGDVKVRQIKDSLSYDFEVQITAAAWSLEILSKMTYLLRKFFENDHFFQIAGHSANHEVVTKNFVFGENDETAHSYNLVVRFWVFENYERGLQSNLVKSVETVNVDINEAEGIIWI